MRLAAWRRRATQRSRSPEGTSIRRAAAAPAAAALAGVALAMLLASCAPARGTQRTGAAVVASPAPARAVEVFGVVRADEVRSIVIEFPARVSRVLVEPGTLVERSQPILVLDAAEAYADIANLDSQIQAAELRLLQRRQEIDRANVAVTQEVRSVEREIASREAELARTRSELAALQAALRQGTDLDLLSATRETGRLAVELELASRDLEVGRRLFAQGGLSQAQLDQRERLVSDLSARLAAAELQLEQVHEAKNRRIDDLEFATGQLVSAIESLRLRLDGLLPSDFVEVKIQEAQIEQLRLQRDRLASRLQRDYLFGDGAAVEVRSPIGPAVAAEITGSPGDLLSSGTRVARLLGTETLSVEAFVPEDFVRDVERLAETTVTLLADRSRVYRGHVEHVAGAAEQRGNETVFRIRVRMDEADPFLRPNMNVDLSIRPVQ